jgi:predicted RNA binding protein YcfA (HicA-like mRNA interferase family)
MPRFPSLKPREVAKALERAGFVFVRQGGSHRVYIKGKVCTTVPWHNKDMKIGTTRSIVKQSGLTPREFLKLIKS